MKCLSKSPLEAFAEIFLDLQMRVEKLENELSTSMTATAPVGVESEWMNIEDAAHFLRVSRKTIYNNPERYHAHKVHGRLFFNRTRLHQLMSAGVCSEERRFEKFEARRDSKKRVTK